MDSSSFSPTIGGWFWVLLLGVLTSVSAESMPEIGDMDGIGASAFSCEGKVIGGYYADVDSGCQMFHVCTLGQEGEIRDIKFLCLAGTIFDQETRVCERSDEVDCSASEQYYILNLDLFGRHGLILPTLTGRKVPPSGAGNTLVHSDPAALSEEERMLLLMEEHQHQNSNNGMLDPDYEDEDYEDELAVIIQQEFETGTTSIPTISTASTTTSTTSTTTTTTTSTTPFPITTERIIIPVFHAFDSGSPDVVHFQHLDVAASHQFNTTSPTPITPPSTTSKPPPPPPTPAMELQPHHYVVRQEFSVTSITSFHPVTKSNNSTTTTRPPTTAAHKSAAQIQEDEDVYELLGQIEADVPRIRSRPQHMSSNVFVPRFKRQAESVKTRVRTRTNPTSSSTASTGSSSSQRSRVRTTTTEIPLPLDEELTEAPATRSPTSRRNRVRSTTTTTTTTESPPVEEPETAPVPDGSHFDCTGRIMGGFYADVQNGCRQFHICGLGKKNRVVTHSFFCGAGLLFDQASLTCQDADKVNCKLSPNFYHLNDRTVLPDPEEFDTFQFKRVRPSAGGR